MDLEMISNAFLYKRWHTFSVENCHEYEQVYEIPLKKRSEPSVY